MTDDGTVVLKVNAGVTADLAGNANTASNAQSINFIHSGTVQFSASGYTISRKSPVIPSGSRTSDSIV